MLEVLYSSTKQYTTTELRSVSQVWCFSCSARHGLKIPSRPYAVFLSRLATAKAVAAAYRLQPGNPVCKNVSSTRYESSHCFSDTLRRTSVVCQQVLLFTSYLPFKMKYRNIGINKKSKQTG